MQYILKGCSTRSDVVQKKAAFYSFLAKFKIHEDIDRDYYNPPEYNCESSDLLNRLTKEFPDTHPDRIANSLRLFTKINYLRKGVSNLGLEQSHAILVSGKNISRHLAFHPSILQEENAVPFSTDIEYFTERLWFKLGKGFGGNTRTPAAFDVVARAQLIISTQIGSKVSSDFKSLLSKVGRGEMSINDASYVVSDLRSRFVRPEELNADNVESISEYLDVASIEAGVRNIRLLEGKAEELEEKNRRLEETLEAFETYKRKALAKEISVWKVGISALKRKAKMNYQLILGSVILTPLFLLIFIAFLLSSSNDTLLSQVGFVVTAAAFVWPFFSVKFVHKMVLKQVRSKFKSNIKNYSSRPGMEN